jgi:pyruvate/2-oxoacid:ferredoxin oxidoreductase alpha subunit
VHDTILLAFRLAEHGDVLLPVMVCQDAFVLSHTMMMTDIAEQDAVDAFLPELRLPHRLTDKPRVVGGLDFPHQTEVHRKQHMEAMERVPRVYATIQEEFERHFGRRPADPVVPYRMEDAEIVVVSMGTTASTARNAVDAARKRGVKAGALRIRMFRPLPEAPLREYLKGRMKVAVVDRDSSPGLGGIVWGEIRGLGDLGAVVQSYMVGLGGGDIRPEHIGTIIDDAAHRSRAGSPVFLEAGE